MKRRDFIQLGTAAAGGLMIPALAQARDESPPAAKPGAPPEGKAEGYPPAPRTGGVRVGGQNLSARKYVNPRETTPPKNPKVKAADKHSPKIEFSNKVRKGKEVVLTISVGEGSAHPMIEGHYIEWISIFEGDTYLGGAEFGPRSSVAWVSLALVFDKPTAIDVYESCNLHGVWKNSVTVTPEDA
ncbi:MAG: hypothetical protein GMKNLPBB_02658 [Myxococcota bacterium]|nr:hypothetical protein [Myxococcota bacterium]